MLPRSHRQGGRWHPITVVTKHKRETSRRTARGRTRGADYLVGAMPPAV
jgi:hypothetical protein